MGSVLDKHWEIEQGKIYDNKKQYLKEISQTIKKINPNSKDYRMVEFLWENRDKIYKNKKLIDLLG